MRQPKQSQVWTVRNAQVLAVVLSVLKLLNQCMAVRFVMIAVCKVLDCWPAAAISS